jgi:hypothetical protein
MSQTAAISMTPPSGKPQWKKWLSLDNRYVPPAFITLILLAGQLSFGILESYERTLLAIVTAVVTELVLGHIFLGKWLNVASAYITGISVGILVRSPAFWPFVVAAALAITSKYVLRYKGRHLWNPSNFGISVMLFLLPSSVTMLSIQWGNNMASMVVIWLLGSIIIWRLHRDLCDFVSGTGSRPLVDHSSALALRGLSNHRAGVSTLHFLHDHRSQNHGAIEEGSMHRGVLCSAPGDVFPARSKYLCGAICAVLGWANRNHR